jgi:hypothetical protein
MSYRPLFRGYVEIYKEYESLYILERNDKKTRCFCVYSRFHELLPIVLGFLTDLQCLRGMAKNSSFLHFRAIFMSYCPQFWGPGVIYKVHDTSYMFERRDEKLVVSVF